MKKRVERGTKNIEAKTPLFELVVESIDKAPIVKLNGEIVRNKKEVRYLCDGNGTIDQSIKIDHFLRQPNGRVVQKTDQITNRMDDIFG